MYNIAIIEDEKSFAEELKQSVIRYATENKSVFNISSFSSIEDFLLPGQVKYDIVFFDIELPGMNGMDGAKLYRQFDTDAVIIFVTNISQFAVKGYEVDAMDYIVKPVSYNNLALKLHKAIRIIEKKQYKPVVINTKDGVYSVRSVDISFIEIFGHCLTFHTDNGDMNATGNLAFYENELKNYNFSRCNSCYLVNMRSISKIEGMSIFLQNGTELTISRRKKKEFFDDFTRYLKG